MTEYWTIKDIKEKILENSHKVGDHFVHRKFGWLFKIISIDGTYVTLLADFAWDDPIPNSTIGRYYTSYQDLNNKHLIKVKK